MLWIGGRAYFFRDDEYIRYDLGRARADDGYPRKIEGNWPGVFESGLNGATIWTEGRAIFFRGPEYVSFDVEDETSTHDPSPIDTGFPGVFPKGIDAAVLWPRGTASAGDSPRDAKTLEIPSHFQRGRNGDRRRCRAAASSSPRLGSVRVVSVTLAVITCTCAALAAMPSSARAQGPSLVPPLPLSLPLPIPTAIEVVAPDDPSAPDPTGNVTLTVGGSTLLVARRGEHDGSGARGGGPGSGGPGRDRHVLG